MNQPVLLFFHGFDLKAHDFPYGNVIGTMTHYARYAKRTLCSQQPHTGLYAAFLSLYKSLKGLGVDVRVNDFAAARKHPARPIGVLGYPLILPKIADLPNPRLLGPGSFGMPDTVAQLLQEGRNKILVQPCGWSADVFRMQAQTTRTDHKLWVWPVGIDTSQWPDGSKQNKTHDFLIYDKIRWDHETRAREIIAPICETLERRGHSWQSVRYAHHHTSEYRRKVYSSRALIFICEHETQGIAYQEAMAAGVPVLALEEGKLFDTKLQAYVPENFEVSAVPYFDDTCGMKFQPRDFESTLDRFWQSRDRFDPRSFIINNLTPEKAARAYLDKYEACAAVG